MIPPSPPYTTHRRSSPAPYPNSQSLSQAQPLALAQTQPQPHPLMRALCAPRAPLSPPASSPAEAVPVRIACTPEPTQQHHPAERKGTLAEASPSPSPPGSLITILRQSAYDERSGLGPGPGPRPRTAWAWSASPTPRAQGGRRIPLDIPLSVGRENESLAVLSRRSSALALGQGGLGLEITLCQSSLATVRPPFLSPSPDPDPDPDRFYLRMQRRPSGQSADSASASASTGTAGSLGGTTLVPTRAPFVLRSATQATQAMQGEQDGNGNLSVQVGLSRSQWPLPLHDAQVVDAGHYPYCGSTLDLHPHPSGPAPAPSPPGAPIPHVDEVPWVSCVLCGRERERDAVVLRDFALVLESGAGVGAKPQGQRGLWPVCGDRRECVRD